MKVAKLKVVNLKSVGHAYRNGTRDPGWGNIILENGDVIYVREDDNSFDKMLEIADQRGFCTVEIRGKLKNQGWLKSGSMGCKQSI